MLNSITPDVGSVPITTVPAPTITITETGFIVLAANVDDDGEVTTAVIAFAATIPVDTDSRGHIALAYVSYTAATDIAPASISISQSVGGSLAHQMCGASRHLFWQV